MTGVKRVIVGEESDLRVDDNDCEVSTVDSFLGRDMDVVILSTVKNVDGGLVSYICCTHVYNYCFTSLLILPIHPLIFFLSLKCLSGIGSETFHSRHKTFHSSHRFFHS
jgi:hypothetical protein